MHRASDVAKHLLEHIGRRRGGAATGELRRRVFDAGRVRPFRIAHAQAGGNLCLGNGFVERNQLGIQRSDLVEVLRLQRVQAVLERVSSISRVATWSSSDVTCSRVASGAG
jgi:hypothetical protein